MNGFFKKVLKDRFTIFIVLLMLYYIVNLLTSSANSGMSGAMLAEVNPYNRIMGGLIIFYIAISSIRGYLKKKIKSYTYIKIFVIYLIISYVICLTLNFKFYFGQANSCLNIIYWLLTFIFCMQCFEKINNKNVNVLFRWITIVYLVFITYRLITQKAILTNEDMVAGINVAGSVYMITPIVSLAFENKYKVIVFIICLFLCILSGKRQAFIGIVIVSFFELPDILKNYWCSYKFKGIIIAVLAICCFKNSIISSFDSLVARQNRIEEVGGSMDSGRSDLRASAMKGYLDADIFQQLLGGGTGVCGLYIKDNYGKFNYPHCGYIEILCDYGLLGFCIFIIILVSLFKKSQRVKIKRYRHIAVSCVSAIVYVNIISHAGNMSIIYLSMALAYVFTYQYKVNYGKNWNRRNS